MAEVERKKRDPAPWGALLIRIILGALFCAHGLMRNVPSFLEETPETPLLEGIVGSESANILLGSGELCVGAFLILGFFLRIALIPALIYLLATLSYRVEAGGGYLIHPSGSVGEEQLLLIALSLSLLILGPGRYSLSGLFLRG